MKSMEKNSHVHSDKTYTNICHTIFSQFTVRFCHNFNQSIFYFCHHFNAHNVFTLDGKLTLNLLLRQVRQMNFYFCPSTEYLAMSNDLFVIMKFWKWQNEKTNRQLEARINALSFDCFCIIRKTYSLAHFFLFTLFARYFPNFKILRFYLSLSLECFLVELDKITTLKSIIGNYEVTIMCNTLNWPTCLHLSNLQLFYFFLYLFFSVNF